MQFDVWSKALSDLSVECIAAGVFEDGKLGTEAAALDKATGGRIKSVVARGDFSGRAGETLLLPEAGLKTTRVVLVSTGICLVVSVDSARSAPITTVTTPRRGRSRHSRNASVEVCATCSDGKTLPGRSTLCTQAMNAADRSG